MHMSFKRYFFNAIISDSARKNAEKIISAQSAKKKVTATADSLRRRTAATGNLTDRKSVV